LRFGHDIKKLKIKTPKMWENLMPRKPPFGFYCTLLTDAVPEWSVLVVVVGDQGLKPRLWLHCSH
jgi:hypothetical protein